VNPLSAANPYESTHRGPTLRLFYVQLFGHSDPTRHLNEDPSVRLSGGQPRPNVVPSIDSKKVRGSQEPLTIPWVKNEFSQVNCISYDNLVPVSTGDVNSLDENTFQVDAQGRRHTCEAQSIWKQRGARLALLAKTWRKRNNAALITLSSDMKVSFGRAHAFTGNMIATWEHGRPKSGHRVDTWMYDTRIM
jgi:hypothetical protein